MIQKISSLKSSQLALLKVLSGFFLMFASAQISIPLGHVPITLQTVAVMLIGLTYSLPEGIATLLAYIVAGSMGLPIFSNFSYGIGGPTTGYIIGFIPAIYFMNKFRVKSFLSIVSACFIGTVTIYTCGIAWLSTLIGFTPAITHGLVPFIIPGIAKGLILSASLKAIGFKR
jgi:biotin transport system substrate-specific component